MQRSNDALSNIAFSWHQAQPANNRRQTGGPAFDISKAASQQQGNTQPSIGF